MTTKPTNPITKAHLEGVEMFEKSYFKNGVKKDCTCHYNPGFLCRQCQAIKNAKSFLTTYGTNLLKAAQEAGPGERKTHCSECGEALPITAEEDSKYTWNSCRTSYRQAIDEGIKEITNI